MARILLDTHGLLWSATDSPRLSRIAAQTLQLFSTEVYVSVASLWEIAIKQSRGDISVFKPLEPYLEDDALSTLGIELLPIRPAHIRELRRLPTPEFSHGDPFDRMIAAQARAEGLDLLSADAKMDAYGVRRVW